MSVRVLVIDDGKVERMYLAGLLQRLGVEADTAESCEDGAAKAGEQKYDLLFIDYFMPDSDGVHTLKEIYSDTNGPNCNTPAIALGLADDFLGDDFFMDQGFMNYLEKPVNFEMLHAALLLYLPQEMRGEIGVAEQDGDQAAADAENGSPAIPELLSGIEDMDTAAGIANCGSEENFMSAVGIFCNSTDKMSDEIQSYYDSENWHDYTIKVHALKSSARIIGLGGLSELARQLEAAGDSGDTGFIRENTDRLLSWYRSYKSKLEPVFFKPSEEDDDSGKPPADPDFLEDAFSSLVEFAGQMDYDMVEVVLEQLGEYRLEPQDKEIADDVNAAFDSFDWSGIRTAAQKYIDRLYGGT